MTHEQLNSSSVHHSDNIWKTALPDDDTPYRENSGGGGMKKRRLSGGGGIEIVKCNICGSHFDNPAQLSDHLMRHDADYRYNPIYKCSYGQCLFRTDDRSLMKHHISRVHLRSEQALVSRKHRNRKLLRPTILCSTCPMVFATESELWQHTPYCKEYRCQFCGQHFWTIEKRYAHEMAYHEEEFDLEEEEEEEEEEFEDGRQSPENEGQRSLENGGQQSPVAEDAESRQLSLDQVPAEERQERRQSTDENTAADGATTEQKEEGEGSVLEVGKVYQRKKGTVQEVSDQAKPAEETGEDQKEDESCTAPAKPNGPTK